MAFIGERMYIIRNNQVADFSKERTISGAAVKINLPIKTCQYVYIQYKIVFITLFVCHKNCMFCKIAYGL
jgi:hypothetical protein